MKNAKNMKKNFYNDTRKKGEIGEKVAEKILIEKGYEIVKRNYFSAFGEIDIIAKKSDEIIFVEVKSRRNGSIETPAEAVTPSKQRKIIKTAEKYLYENENDLYPRFDVIEIFFSASGYKIIGYNHITNAFYKNI